MLVEQDSKTSSPSNAQTLRVIEDIRARLDDLERDLRGHTPRKRNGSKPKKSQAAEPAPSLPPRELTLADRIEIAIRKESLSAQQIAKAVGEPLDKIQKELRALVKTGQIINVWGLATDAKATWHWAVDSKSAPNTARRELIKQLLMERPMSHSEIRAATGATDAQTQDDIVEIRRKEVVWKMNHKGHNNLYWIPPDRAEPPPDRDARLQPKAWKKKTDKKEK